MNTRLCLMTMVALTLVACHTAPAQMSPAGYQGRTFLLQSSQGADLLAKGTVRLRFWESEISFIANCNQMHGSYTVEQERVMLNSMFRTLMGCDAERYAQDEWLEAFFTSKPKLVYQGNTLTLSNDGSNLVFLDREIADPDRPFQGTTWEVQSYIDAETSTASVYGEIEAPRLTFAPDGTWQARSECLDAGGRYTIDDARIKLVDTRATQGACTFYDQIAADFMRSVLVDGELTYEIEADWMYLTSSGFRSLEASAVETKSAP